MKILAARFRITLQLIGVVCGAIAASALMGPLASAQTAQQGAGPSSQSALRPSASQLQSWRAALPQAPPSGKGCFTAKYPDASWYAAACVTPPNAPFPPPARTGIPSNGVHQPDYVAKTTNLITSAKGSFDAVTGVLSEADGGTANSYSLQLNSNFFSKSPACATAKSPASCLAWEQFVYDNVFGGAYIQYWLIDYANTCPSGWNTFGSDCWKNAPTSAFYGPQAITELASLQLSGAASTGNDTITISGADGNASAVNTDSVLSLDKFWNNAEFNVIGDGGGSRADFNSGVTIKVRTAVNSGTTAAPGCAAGGTTAESNNLQLAATCSSVGGSAPAVLFSESDPPGSIWQFTGAACTGASCPGWKMLDNNNEGVRIAATGSNLYELWNTGNVFEYTGTACSGSSCPGWKQLDQNSNTVEIVAGGNNLYQLQNTGKLYQYTGSSWLLLDNNPNITTMVAASGGLYELHNKGQIWQYTGVACNSNGASCPGWKELDNNSKAVAITAGASNLYELHNDGTVYKYTGTACTTTGCPGWQKLNANAKALTIVAGGNNLFELDNNGVIWQYTGTACSGNSCPGWKMLDNNAAAIDIAADSSNNLYELHKTGGLYHYTGTACTGASCPGWKEYDNNSWTGRIAASNGILYQLHVNQASLALALTCYDCR